MNTIIKLKKFGFGTVLPNARDFYKVLENNRGRLSPWFWWTDEKVTPNFTKTVIFSTLYILDTKIQKMKYNLSLAKSYDEQFLIFYNDKMSGMTGLDNINHPKNDAEIWYFITAENEGQGVMSASLKKLQDYASGKKKLNYLYAKTAVDNTKSESFLARNYYKIEKIEMGVPTSRRNPKITDLKTWGKQI